MAATGDEEFPTAKYYSSPQEVEAYRTLEELLATSPIPPKEILGNLGLYLTPAYLARLLFMHNVYQRILHVHGVIMEFGVRWGPNLALFSTFRSIYEARNHSRRVVGFDTFEGMLSAGSRDGPTAAKGVWAVTPKYEDYLAKVLNAQEALAPRSHIQKYEVVKGDVVHTLPEYLARRPETIIALAYFNLDLYEPTLKCLKLIRDRLPRGSIVAFNELTMEQLPGETLAVLEGLGITNREIVRDPTVPYQSYIVMN